MMSTPWPHLLAATAFCLALLPARAADPGTSEMIEALKPAPVGGLRNLVIRTRPEAAASGVGQGVATAPAAGAAPAPGATPQRLALQVLFGSNSAQIRPESAVLLGNLAAAMLSADLLASRFQIEGHTDAAGSASANLRLSQTRAEQVRSRLVALGVDVSRLQAVGRGSGEPLDTKNPRAAANRRVQVVTVQ